MSRSTTALAVAIATLALACTTERAANLRHPVGGTTRLTAAAVAPEDRYEGTPPRTPLATATPITVTGEACRTMPPVEFVPGSSTLEPSQRGMLETVAKCHEADPAGTTIMVVGYGDPSSNAGMNRSLGAERAAEVRDRLVGLGVPGDRIFVSAPEWTAVPAPNADRSRGVEMFVDRPRDRR